MPLISVIIPTYNRSAFLREAVDSVLQQTAGDLELIVADDGSTENTKVVCERYSEKLRYLFQPNRGVSAARNLGLQQAQGEFIAFLDSDDLWTPRKLARQAAWMAAHPGARLCHTNEIWIRRGRRVNQKKIHQKAGGWIYPLCLPRCIISPSAVLLRRELFEQIGVFDEALPICEDYDLWLRAAARFEVGFLDEPLIVKRGGHEDQLSRSEWGIDRYRVYALLKILAAGQLPKDWKEQTVATLKEKCHILASGYRKHGNIMEANLFTEVSHDSDQGHFDPHRLLRHFQRGAGTRQHDRGAI
jgi:glycosyltransferase involved in cell wall biosynthesis